MSSNMNDSYKQALIDNFGQAAIDRAVKLSGKSESLFFKQDDYEICQAINKAFLETSVKPV